jgi:hypothetical protein
MQTHRVQPLDKTGLEEKIAKDKKNCVPKTLSPTTFVLGATKKLRKLFFLTPKNKTPKKLNTQLPDNKPTTRALHRNLMYAAIKAHKFGSGFGFVCFFFVFCAS